MQHTGAQNLVGTRDRHVRNPEQHVIALDDLRIGRRRPEMPRRHLGRGAAVTREPQLGRNEVATRALGRGFAQGVFYYAHFRTGSAWPKLE